MDEVSEDMPKGTWNVLSDTSETVAILRNKLWPGYYAYHRVNSHIFGGIYYGNGIKNLDLLFLI